MTDSRYGSSGPEISHTNGFSFANYNVQRAADLVHAPGAQRVLRGLGNDQSQARFCMSHRAVEDERSHTGPEVRDQVWDANRETFES